MNRPALTTTPRTGRTLGLVAGVFGVSWLVWRMGASLAGAPVWSAAGALAVEMLALASFGSLVWALWHRPRPGADPGDPPTATTLIRVDTTADRADLPEHLDALAASLLAAGPVGPTLVLYHDRLVTADGTVVVEQFDDGSDRLAQAAHHIDTPWLLLLDAGDVPVPDIAARLLGGDIDGVAVVQGACVEVGARTSLAARSLTRAVDEGLGARGLARLTGSGAMVRTAALRALEPGDTPRAASATMAALHLTVALQRAGWQITAPSGAVVVVPGHGDASPGPTRSGRDGVGADPVRAERIRADEACAARAALATAVRRDARLGMRHRVGLLAGAVLALAGVSRTLLAIMVGAALLDGRLPFRLAPGPLIGVWLPWFVLAAVALWQLSDGAMRPGSRSLDATARVGTSWRGVATPNGAPIVGRSALGTLLGLDHGAAVVAFVGGLSIVLCLRGLSDRVTHTLHPLDTVPTVALLVVALWLLAAGLVHLRLLAVRPQPRRAGRVVASFASTFAGAPALVADITTRGAAVVGPVSATVGEQAELELVLPSASGCVSARLPVTVRHVRPARSDQPSGDRRVGVEFAGLPAHVHLALTERCVVQPALATLGAPVAAAPGSDGQRMVLDAAPPTTPRRTGLRLASLVALVGAVASALAPSAEAASATPVVLHGRAGDPSAASLVVVDLPTTSVRPGEQPPLPAADGDAAQVTVVCASGAGRDDLFGTADDTYAAPRTAQVGGDGSYEVALDRPLGRSHDRLSMIEPGAACWHWVLPSRRAAAGSATVQHLVWRDLDLDGIADPGEPRLGAVGVALVAVDADGEAHGVDATTVTDPAGGFEFRAVAPGRYRIVVTGLPDGLVTFDVLGRSEMFEIEAGQQITGDEVRGLGTIDLGTRTALSDGASERVLPAVSIRDVAPPAPASPAAWRWVVPVLTLLLGLPLLTGLLALLPTSRRRRSQSGWSTSPPLAIR